MLARLGRLRPAGPTSITRQAPAALGALLAMLLTALVSRAALGAAADQALPFLIAPMAASAVLLFCLPAAPLAQPWPVIGGNVVSALVGVACAQAVDPLVAAPLAGGLAIAAMASLRCLHPPGGAVAVTAVLGGAPVLEAGYWFVLAPVALNSVLMVGAAVAWNRLSGHDYPHVQPAANVSEEKAGFAGEDLDAALDSYGETLDVSREDLATIFAKVEEYRERRAAGRELRRPGCGALARPVPASLAPEMPLAAARVLLLRHGVPALPVVDAAGRLTGVLSMAGLVAAGGSASRPLPARARRAAGLLFGRDMVPAVGDLAEADFAAVRATAPLAALLARLRDGAGLVFVVDEEGRLAGMVRAGDLLAELDADFKEEVA